MVCVQNVSERLIGGLQRYSHILCAGLQHQSMHAVSAQAIIAKKVRIMGMRERAGLCAFGPIPQKRWYGIPDPAIVSEYSRSNPA